MIERHHDYVARAITQNANTTQRYVVKIDSDAPFALRQLLQSNMNGFQMRIFDNDDRAYSQGMPLTIADPNLNPPTANPNQIISSPIYPQITFPPLSTITFDVLDLSGTGQSNGVIVFRGVKLFNEGRVFAPQYPAKFQGLNSRYLFKFKVPLGSGATPSVLSSQPMTIQPDADFVFRMASMSYLPTDPDTYDILGTDVMIRDQYGKAYSNDWVPMQYIFPVPQPATFGVFGGNANQSFFPAVTVYPEIYLQRNSPLLIDIRRRSGTGTVNMNFVLHGMKVFPA